MRIWLIRIFFLTATFFMTTNLVFAGIEPEPFFPGDWQNSFVLDMTQGTNGYSNPGLIVGFNPQPEPPPLPPDMNLTNTLKPIISVYDSPVNTFNLVFGFTGTDPLLFEYSGTPDMSGHYEFDVLKPSIGLPILDFTVMLDLMTSSGGVPVAGSWVGFNPQPEPPPGDFSGGIGYSFEFSSMSDAYLSFAILDNAGAPVELLDPNPVPEPATMLLLGTGLVGVAGASIRKKKSQV